MELRANNKYAFLHSNIFYLNNYVTPSNLKSGKINSYICKNNSVDKSAHLTTSSSVTKDEV